MNPETDLAAHPSTEHRSTLHGLPPLAGRPFACVPDVSAPSPPPRPGAAVPGEEYRVDIHAALEKSIHAWTTLAELRLPRREPLLDEWFMEGDLGFVYAPRGLGKTWLSLSLAAALSSGGKCGPWQAAGARRVLYVDGEMPCEALHERIAGMGAGGNLSVLNHGGTLPPGRQRCSISPIRQPRTH